MTDPYKILGVSPYDTDEKIKSAYRDLAKKYHPDNYNNGSESDIAEEKMKEINEAYDQIMAERRKKRSGNYSSYTSYNDANNNYRDIRNMIMSGRISNAEQILDGIPIEQRNAEWHFLKGTIFYKKGWLEEAYNYFNKACNMDPQNSEYRSALNQINNQRSGFYGGYNPMASNRGCSGCDICTSLLCADCCCECMGGDFIRCC